MSLLNPFASFAQLNLVPVFLHSLRTDLGRLFTRDLRHTINLPPRAPFSDDAAYWHAISEARRLLKREVVKEALEKQLIRESLWPRFRVCGKIAMPLVWLFNLAVLVVWIACLSHDPDVLDFINPLYWLTELQYWAQAQHFL